AVNCTASATGGTPPVTFSWTATAGSPSSGTGSSFSTTYNTKGTKTITVTGTDSASPANTATASATVTINPLALSVTASGPTSATIGQAVTYTASATGGTSPYTFAWTATGGSPSSGTGSSFTTTFNSAGTFTVTVTATDGNSKTASNSVTVTVGGVSGANPTQTTINCNPGSVMVNGAVTCTARVVDKSTTSPSTPTGTVSFTTNSTGTFTPTSCTLIAGPGNSHMGSCMVSYTGTVVGQHMLTASYNGDSTHASSSSTFILNVRGSSGKVLLSFSGYDVDDWDNGVGQLQVLVNGNLVADIPAGINSLTGSGDFQLYDNVKVDFGPFDITSYLTNGQNTILFKDANPGDHFAVVSNVVIKQDGNTLLKQSRSRGVYPAFSFSYTFAFPSGPTSNLTTDITSLAISANQPLLYSAAYTGSGSFSCVFSFGEGQQAKVASVDGTCITWHQYSSAGTFNVTVAVTPTTQN
ncbi:PKD domain-containing protein, partial [Candidatus Bathyarchaeota archaeon]|nr:PKD domain-containing protein [Candidatus Bathyarchaeota archaeon]